MQSYKLRKTSETALYPIENELKMLRQETDKNWTTLIKKIMSVVFSGIGTTLLSQTEYLPTLIKYIIAKTGVPISTGGMFIVEACIAFLIFVSVSAISFVIINLLNRNKDNKKGEQNREDLAEKYHKVILNDIITGISFTKKSKGKLKEMKKALQEMEDKEDEEKKEDCLIDIRKYKQETCLYIAEANYYFSVAEAIIREKEIVEKGTRDNYLKFLDKVGIDTLLESLLMFESALINMTNLLSELKIQNECIWEKKDNELIFIFNNMIEIGRIRESIIGWKTNLCDTAKEIQPEKDYEAEQFLRASNLELPTDLQERLKKYKSKKKNMS